MPAANSIPISGDISALDPATPKIVDEVILGMLLQRLVAVSEGRFSEDDMHHLLASFT